MADVTTPEGPARVDPATRIGAVHLTVSDLDRAVRFYTERVGLILRRRDDRDAWLGAGAADLLALRGEPEARRARGTTGLYHFAILVPSRADLARAVRHLLGAGTRMQGFSDHGVSEAAYLADPDGNGIEIYRDRPRPEWPYAGGHLQMTTRPLDLDDLLRDAGDGGGASLAPGTTVGHVHLHVADLAAAESFYTGVLGFDRVQRYGGEALFVSAGGYHHHIGLNTWAGVGAPPPPPGAIGLRWFDLLLPDAAARDRVTRRVRAAGVAVAGSADGPMVRDPSGNVLRFIAGG